MTASFSDLIQDPELIRALNELNFATPTPIQEQAVPVALEGRDMIIQARTGSGKTLAYAIPLIALSRSLEHKHQSPRVVVLVPTRELANQARDVIASVTANLPEGRYETPCIIGGADMEAQIEKLERDCRIVVATPGRMLDLMRQRRLRLNACKLFVLDEADEMLSTGFLEDIRIILSRLPDQRQGMFVSATITPRVEMLANSFLEKPAHIAVDSPGEEMPPIEHLFAEVGGDLMAKPNALCDIIETFRPSSAIVFCNTKSDTQLVEALLRRRGFEARRLNSDLSQKQRERVMKKIRNKELPILVATDIAARGIDIEALDMVINFAIHETPEIYVHRTGRTGRAGRSGTAVSLVGPRDFGAFHFLKKVINADLKKIELPTDDEIAQARLAHLYQMLRESKLQIGERDKLIARKLVTESSGAADLPEDFVEIMAKLCRHMMEHHVSIETKALEEEIPAEEPTEEKKERRPRGEYEGRGEREEHGERRSRSDREDREHRRRENPREERQNSHREENDSGVIPVRVFLGQGQKHGLGEEQLHTLVKDHASVEPSELRASIIRESYSFLEVEASVAERLIRSLNGMAYNGGELLVEPAIEMVGPKRHQSRGRGKDRGRDRRQDNRRHRN